MRPAYIAALLMTLAAPAWPQAPPRPPSSETRSWKSYRTQKYHFEFRYPPELWAVETGPNSVERRLMKGEQISGTQPPLVESVQVKDRKGGVVLTFDIPDQKRFPILFKESQWSLRACGEEGFEDTESKTETYFGPYRVLQVITNASQYYCINYPPNPVIIHFDSTMSDTPIKILSTLKFLK